jgi:hypothetical protein
LKADPPGFPNLRFQVEDMIIEGGPWSTCVATRYAATRNGQVIYRGINVGRIVRGKVVEERILPATQALAAALAERGGYPGKTPTP